MPAKKRHPIAAIDAVVAFRHVGPFPEWAEQHPQHKDILLCPECLEDWCEATLDPTFDDRVIAKGLVYLDADGQETDDATGRYVEALMRSDILVLLARGGPKRCAACQTSWDRVAGMRVSFR